MPRTATRTHFVIVGSAAPNLEAPYNDPTVEEMDMVIKEHAVATVVVDENRVEVILMGFDGTVLDSFSVTK